MGFLRFISSLVLLSFVAQVSNAEQCKSSYMTDAFAKFNAYQSEDKESGKSEWSSTKLAQSIKQGFKITCHTRPLEKTTLVASEIIYEDADIEKVATAYADHFDVDPDLKEFRVVEKREDSTVYYCKYGIPIPFVSDRDVVFETSVENVAGGIFILLRDVEHADVPVDSDNYRMNFWTAAFFKQEGKDVKCTSFESVDAGHKLLNGFDANAVVDEVGLILKKMSQN